MHPILAIGIDNILRNTQRVRRAMEREQKNPAPPEAIALVAQMNANYDNEFVSRFVTLLEMLTGVEFPKRNSLYTMIKTEPFIAVVMMRNTNGADYPCDVPLITTLNGRAALIKPDGSTGNAISENIRLATDEEITGLAQIIGVK